METACPSDSAIQLPHAILLDIPQAGHVTLITLGRSRERSRTSSITGSTPHRGGARLELGIVKGHNSLPSP